MMTYHAQSDAAKEQLLVLGIGGSGCNVLKSLAKNIPAQCDLVSLQTDSRLSSEESSIRVVRMGEQLTRGLGCGGDPELGLRSAEESRTEISRVISGRKVILICTGLGGGTGSGAAPVVAKLAREAGAFVAIFATLPFSFEGRRRETQAREALEQLELYSNAMVVFENVRMGELPESAGGVYAAFAAADTLISHAIEAISRIATNPGLIHLGLDDVTAVLRGNRSRVLFGTGIAQGSNRAINALKEALQCPLLDRGRLLKESKELMIHIMGGSSLALQEVESIMSELGKVVNPGAQLHFGAAVDDKLDDRLVVTLLSSLPEDIIWGADKETSSPAKSSTPTIEPTISNSQPEVEVKKEITPEPIPAPAPTPAPAPVVQETPAPEPVSAPSFESKPAEPAKVTEEHPTPKFPAHSFEAKPSNEIGKPVPPPPAQDRNSLTEAEKLLLERRLQEAQNVIRGNAAAEPPLNPRTPTVIKVDEPSIEPTPATAPTKTITAQHPIRSPRDTSATAPVVASSTGDSARDEFFSRVQQKQSLNEQRPQPRQVAPSPFAHTQASEVSQKTQKVDIYSANPSENSFEYSKDLDLPPSMRQK